MELLNTGQDINGSSWKEKFREILSHNALSIRETGKQIEKKRRLQREAELESVIE
jgi:hypothetical protein